MSAIPDMVPVSGMSDKRPPGILRRVQKKAARPVVITQRGRAAAVMVGVDEYRRAEQEREMLGAPQRREGNRRQTRARSR